MSSLGHITVELLCRLGDGEPQSLGFVRLPLTVKSVSTGTIEANLAEAVAVAKISLEQIFGDES